MSWVRRILLGLVSLLVLLGVIVAVAGPPAVRRSFPQTGGELHLSGLDGPVDIYRDSYGVPHIYASSEHDLFFAQGYIHAQDRFWQMDFWRHQGAGRLSELLGDATRETDIFLRTLGWERVARQELAALDADSLTMLEAYAQGVNAYLANHAGSAISLEYLFLPILNRGYTPAPWEPIHTLTWAKAMAWDLGGNMDLEIDRALLLKNLSPEQVDRLYPPYPEDRPVIVRQPHVTGPLGGTSVVQSDLTSFATPALEGLRAQLAALDPIGPGMLGSNSWVIAGEHTDTGAPLLANDPHLGVMIPAIWYEVGLHCDPGGADCDLDVTGLSFAGAPGVIIGHNDRIAWGFTNTGPDVMDLYIEKINPDNPNQYEYQGQWQDMEVVTEVIQVAGGDPVELQVRLTRHGPIINEAFGLEEFAQDAGVEVPEHFAIALRWTSLEPNFTYRAIWNLNRARDWDAFRAAAREFAVPAQNLVYADVEGNIGYQMPGNIPVRAEGHTGTLPVPGWTGEYEWQGYIPYEDLPFAFNPPEGYIVTANNAVVGPEYPYTISRGWDYGLRAQRIVDMIESASRPISQADVQVMQGDNRDLNAGILVPILQEIPLEEGRLVQARSLLTGWDYQNDMDSAPAALFAGFWKHLVLEIFEDDLPESIRPSGNDRWIEVVEGLLDDPTDPWWDDSSTPDKETRDDIFRKALGAAVDELQESLGEDPEGWTWGDLHTVTFRNQVMTSIPLINTLFDRGPFRASGGGEIVNATGWSAAAESYEVGSLPSMRMVVDLEDMGRSSIMHTTGQSGHAYHDHYIDMADPWRRIEYHPMLWSRDEVEAGADTHLRLVP
jgi:penicillin amidase